MDYQFARDGPGPSDGTLHEVATEEYVAALEQLYEEGDDPADGTYQAIEALDVAALPETVSVDRRGYSPAIGDEIGQDYLEDTVLVFGQEQDDAGLAWEEFSFMGELLDDVYANRSFLQKATGTQAVAVDVHFDYTRTDFEVRALLDSEDVKERLQRAQEVKGRAEAIGGDDIKDGDYLDDVQDDISEMLDAFGDLQEIELREELGRVDADRFAFNKPGRRGYMFHGDPPSCLLTDGDAGDWEDMRLNFYTVQEDRTTEVSEALQQLYEAGAYTVDEDAAIEDMKWLGELVLKQQDIDAEPGNISFYKKLKDNKEDLPEEWHAVRDLVKNGDIDFDRDEDSVKLHYLEPTNDMADDVLEQARQIQLGTDEFRERFTELEEAVTDEESDCEQEPGGDAPSGAGG